MAAGGGRSDPGCLLVLLVLVLVVLLLLYRFSPPSISQLGCPSKG
jgi:hypothetical protein